MLTEKEVIERGYEKTGENLYKKNGQYYVQHYGELKLASFLSDVELKQCGAYEAYRKVSKNDPVEKKKETKKTPEEKKPSQDSKGKTEVLIVRDENEAHDFMNIKDDEQVLAEMQGKYLEEFVYSFPTKEGRTVTGLSWAGVKEVVRSAGNIEVVDLKVNETDKTYRVEAKARDLIRNVAMFGVAEQSKKMKLKDGTEIEDLHAISKAYSRAQRNALRILIPELTIKTMIETYLAEKKKQ